MRRRVFLRFMKQLAPRLRYLCACELFWRGLHDQDMIGAFPQLLHPYLWLTQTPRPYPETGFFSIVTQFSDKTVSPLRLLKRINA